MFETVLALVNILKLTPTDSDWLNIVNGHYQLKRVDSTMMISLGCIQALECNTNKCPTGVATQDNNLAKGLDVNDKKVRVANFHGETVKSAVELLAAAGINHPSKLHRSYIYRRVSAATIQTYAETYPYMLRGSLLEPPFPPAYELDMANSSAETFEHSISYA